MSFTPSDIAAIASAITAVVALFVAVWSTHVQRVHARRSTTPHIDFVYGNTDTGPLALKMVSNGIGPAKIVRFTVSLDGEIVKPAERLDVWDMVASKGNFHLPANANEPNPGQYLASGTELMLLDFAPELDLTAPDARSAVELINAYEGALQRISVRVDYESVYGDAFGSSWRLEPGAERYADSAWTFPTSRKRN